GRHRALDGRRKPGTQGDHGEVRRRLRAALLLGRAPADTQALRGRSGRPIDRGSMHRRAPQVRCPGSRRKTERGESNMLARSFAGTDLLRATGRILGVATSLAVFALGASGYLNGGTFRGIEYWWIATLGLSALPFALGLWTRWQSAGVMAALFLAGFAAQLALKDPFWFQHFRLSAGGLSPAMLAVVGVQGIAAAAYLWRTGGPGHLTRIGGAMGWGRLALLAFVLVVASKAAMDFIATENPARYLKQLAIAVVFLG